MGIPYTFNLNTDPKGLVEEKRGIYLLVSNSGKETLVMWGDKKVKLRKVTTYLFAIKVLLLLVVRVKLSLNPIKGAKGVWLQG